MESKYMTLEKYVATLKVGDEVTIEYHSMAGDRQTIEKILKITKSGTIYLRSTNCKDAIRFRKIDRIHQQILYAPRLANHQHSKR